ncbi:MAG: hypothetical protein MI742_14815 [Desulfobacterales bacterium]|nr:hypothetical protein [Desulfobacterales bacterium]
MRAREILKEMPEPLFYSKQKEAVAFSRLLFKESKPVQVLIHHLESEFEEDFGHGFFHSEKVAVEAGAIVHIERGKNSKTEEIVFKAHVAGLLHDTMRKHPDHAEKGACYAEELLPGFAFSLETVQEIAYAIRLHEAFKTCTITPPSGKDAPLLSKALYDADKFRWGPDNFSHTVWDMVSYAKIPLPLFMSHYPKGLKGIEKIKETFRTPTGKLYGPDFIRIGLAVGQKLHTVILEEFSPTCRGMASFPPAP